MTAGLLLATSQPVLAGTSTTTEILQDHPDPSLVGQGIVVVTKLDAGGGAPTGTITVTDGTDSCTVTLPETFCLYRPQSAGSKSLTASYSGDSTFDASISAPVTHAVERETLPERVSIPDQWGQFGPLFGDANDISQNASTSANGRFVAFTSRATNLVSGDTNGAKHIFVHDRQAGTTERVSVASSGTEGDGRSSRPSISADGRFVAFESEATNLVAGDTNSVKDVFVHDRETGATDRVSVDSAGVAANNVSGAAAIAENGRFVAFSSAASNLVSSDNVVTNPGPSAVVDARVEDPEPARLTFGNWQCAPAGLAVCDTAMGSGPVDVLVTIPEGDSVTLTVDAQLIDTDTVPVTNTATVTAPNDVIELNASDNSDSDTDAVGMFVDSFETVEPD